MAFCYFLFVTRKTGNRKLVVFLLAICTDHNANVNQQSTSDASTLQANVSQCIVDVASWTSTNRLQLNAQKRDRVYLVRSCTPSPSHSQWRRTGRPRLSSSGPVSQRARCVRRQWHDNEDSHQSCTVVMLLRIETDQIHHAVSAITRA